MARILACLVLFSFLLSNPASTAPSAPSLDSIRPLQTTVSNDEIGKSETVNICTAWAARDVESVPVWVTAGHCVIGRVDNLSVDGKPVRVKRLVFNEETAQDIATLTGGPRAQPFQLALGDALQLFKPLWSSGFPHGATDRHTVVGSYAGREEGLVLYQIPVRGGLSGAPVVSLNDQVVVGMITQTECFPTSSWCPVARGMALAEIRAALGF